uniref:Uncharacterized protein n=1 Tax=Sinocyclocheilus rhinocerous TaxID=307959 RepID=A0A673M723_9TELE
MHLGVTCIVLCLVISIVCSAALEQGKSSWTGKLLVVPMDGSHWTGVKAVAEEMGRRGHTVIPEISMRLGPGKHYITKTFPVTYGQDLIDQMIGEHVHELTEPEQSLLKSVSLKVDFMRNAFNYMASTTESLLKSRELIEFLREQNFDAVLTDPALPMGTILAYNLSVPAVYIPDPPSYIPRFFTQYSDRMSFSQCVLNVFVSMLEPLICKFVYWPFEELTSNFLQRDVSLTEILSTGAVWLMRYDFSLEFPKPLMPNMQLIGGINCGIRNPLNKVSSTFILNTWHEINVFQIQFSIFIFTRDYNTLSEIKVQKLSLGWYLFKRYTFVPFRY